MLMMSKLGLDEGFQGMGQEGFLYLIVIIAYAKDSTIIIVDSIECTGPH